MDAKTIRPKVEAVKQVLTQDQLTGGRSAHRALTAGKACPAALALGTAGAQVGCAPCEEAVGSKPSSASAFAPQGLPERGRGVCGTLQRRKGGPPSARSLSLSQHLGRRCRLQKHRWCSARHFLPVLATKTARPTSKEKIL